MLVKRLFGRSNGHPEVSDCSGNAGIVVSGGGWKDWTVVGSADVTLRRIKRMMTSANKKYNFIVLVVVWVKWKRGK